MKVVTYFSKLVQLAFECIWIRTQSQILMTQFHFEVKHRAFQLKRCIMSLWICKVTRDFTETHEKQQKTDLLQCYLQLCMLCKQMETYTSAVWNFKYFSINVLKRKYNKCNLRGLSAQSFPYIEMTISICLFPSRTDVRLKQ